MKTVTVEFNLKSHPHWKVHPEIVLVPQTGIDKPYEVAYLLVGSDPPVAPVFDGAAIIGGNSHVLGNQLLKEGLPSELGPYTVSQANGVTIDMVRFTKNSLVLRFYNNGTSTHPASLDVRLMVKDTNGNVYLSPDPQIVLEPKPPPPPGD